MPSVKESLSPILSKYLRGVAAQSVINSLPPFCAKAPGELNIIEVGTIQLHLKAAFRTFSTNIPTEVESELRRAITAGRPPAPFEVVISVRSDSEVLEAQTRSLNITRTFFGASDSVRIATIVSELARNIYMYARTGEIRLSLFEGTNSQTYFQVIAKDQGPGIPNLSTVLSGKYVSRTGLGRGLIGAKAMMDSLEIDSAPGRGTLITATKKVRS